MIIDLYKQKRSLFSVEVFPPKRDDDIQSLYDTLNDIKEFSPDFISVTYGAGGSTSKKTLAIASYIQNICHIEALTHLTCVAMEEMLLQSTLNEINSQGLHNILALRGDKPLDMSEDTYINRSYKHASDIIPIIKSTPSICVAAACYPEKHIEALSVEEDLVHLKEKVNCGVDFLITQLFFDNSRFYQFLENLHRKDITQPVSAGIMPITSLKQMENTIKLSGAAIPKKLSDIISRYQNNPVDLKKAGLDYAIEQISDLLSSKVDGIHLYTMNKSDTCKTIFSTFPRI
jgi:methylenetetrahydrofolate reductase (NADPH)